MRQLRLILPVLFVLALAPRARAADTATIHPIRSFGLTQCGSVFDARRNRLIVVGGHVVASHAAVEVLDLSGAPEWQRPVVAGTPADLGEHPIALMDSLHDRVLVIQPGATAVYSLSLATPMTWSTLEPAGMPEFRDRVMAVYDPVRNRVIGHGGVDHNRLRIYDLSVDETWAITLDGAPSWSMLNPAGGAPPGRADGNALWDPESDRMLVYGGVTYGETDPSLGTDRDDLWQLSFAGGIPTWNPVTPTGLLPPPRRGAAAVLDRAHRQLVVFGGYRVDTILGDLWTFDLSPALAWQQEPDVGPQGRFSAAAAYDVTAQRMLVAGGSGSSAAFPELGDAWQLRLEPTPGPWEPINATGNRILSASFGGYDPSRRGFLALSGGLPWLLSTEDFTWHAELPRLPPLEFFLGPYLDPATNTYFGVPKHGDNGLLDTLYTLHQGPDATWTASPIPTPVPPNANQIATTWFDRKRSRILMIGLAKAFTRDGATNEFWALSVGSTPAWTRIASTTPLGIRATLPIEDVRRDRLVIFGGNAVDGFGFPYAPLGDLYELDLNTLAFRALPAAGTPPSERGNFAAAYDSTRDRAVIAGGAVGPTSLPGAYYLQFGPSDAAGAWLRNDPIGPPVTTDPFGTIKALSAAIDVERDVMYIADVSRLIEIRWNQPVIGLDVSGPRPAVWIPGSVLPLTFSATQLVPGARRYAWSMRSQRAWPAFPLEGFLDFIDAATITFPIGIPVPDTAIAGTDTLTLVMHDLANSGLADSCTAVIGAASSGVVWSPATLSQDDQGVHLTWTLVDTTQSTARIERREGTGAWRSQGDVAIGADRVVRFTDMNIVPGTIYMYRAGIAAGDGFSWSDVASIQVLVPVVRRLAFASPGTLLVRGALTVGFSVPLDAPAELAAFDLTGRQVASATTTGGGEHIVPLATAGQLPAGLYVLRLSQGGAEVKRRAVVLP